MKARFQQLDALRGFAIFTMILSGSIAFGDILPAWMFHAQVPPPSHQFNPQIPGITWVDLVFPFFIFCMGAAVPIALYKNIDKLSTSTVMYTAARRYFLLIYFALFFEHFKANRISENPSSYVQVFSILGFILLMLSFTKWNKLLSGKMELFLNYSGFIIGVLLLIFFPFNNGRGFQINTSDIIIIVLANMALFGTIFWWITKSSIYIRLGILPFIMAIFFTSKLPGTWNEWLFNLTPSQGIYRFYFLKYFFVFIPGTIAGEWLIKKGDDNFFSFKKTNTSVLFLGSCITLLIGNLIFLFSRTVNINLVFTILMLANIHYLFFKTFSNQARFLRNCLLAGTYSLLLGLFFEAFEGGIKKDPSTYSYYFVTSGFAFFSFIIFSLIGHYDILKKLNQFFILVGQNPMMAYVLGSLVLIPFMKIFGIYTYWSMMNSNWFFGFMKGLLFTVIVCGITIPFTKRGIIWKT